MNQVLEIILNLIWLHVLWLYYALESIVLFIFPRRKSVTGEVTLVTGAGSGLGQGICVEFAKRGAIIVGWDISQDGLDETQRMIESEAPGAQFHPYICDITDREAIYKLAERVREEVGYVNILVNNAGIVTGKKFLDSPDKLLQKTMDVNTTAHFWTLKAFLPDMIDANHGHIVSIASGAGFFGSPGLIDYTASKFGAVGLSEALMLELQHLNTNNIKMTVVCPSYIDTGMFKGVGKLALIPMIKKKDAVDAIIDAVLCNQYLLMLPKALYFMWIMKPLVPTKLLFVMAKTFGVSGAMDTFVGRNKQK